MSETSTRYDGKEKTLWVYRKFDEPKTLVPSDELQKLTKQLQSGKTADGEPLKHINVVFSDEQSAEYNHQPLTFSKLGVFVGDLDDSTRYRAEDGDPSFDTRSDFGIE
jgi:hypothetical protein